jgi:hypothetical protein
VLAPGYQASLFPRPIERPAAWRVVDAAGRRAPSTPLLALAVGQARALALAEGRAWIVADDTDAAEVIVVGAGFSVIPRGPGWPAVVSQILADHGADTKECA